MDEFNRDFTPLENENPAQEYNPESEYAEIDTTPAREDAFSSAPEAALPKTENESAPDDDAIPFFTPAQYAQPQKVTQPAAASPEPAAQPAAPAQPQEATPYAQPLYRQPQPAPAQPYQPGQGQYQPGASQAQTYQPQNQPYPYAAPAAGAPVQPYAASQPAPQAQPVTQQPAYPPQTAYAPYPQSGQPQGNIRPQAYAPAQPYQRPQPYAQPQVSAQPKNPAPRLDANPYAQQNNASYARPYAQNGYPYTAPQKPKTPTGTKVFIAILCVLLAALVIIFTAYIAFHANTDHDTNSLTNNGGEIIIDNGDDLDGLFGDYIQNYSDYEFDEEITLIEDNGETQQRSTDNADSIGEPDKNAKGITLKSLPKDKDNEKYTTQAAYDAVCDSVVSVICYNGDITGEIADIVSQGTGTIISENGYIVTNAHVIGNSRSYAVNIILNSGDEYQAKIVGYDTWTDLAVLKIDAKNLSAVEFGDSDLIEIGQDVIAIGNPGGTTFKNSLTKGIVSAVERELSIYKNVKYIQSDAAINPGNSGGPLCNIYGQVIGINSAKITSTLYEGMSFSIPSATVEEIVNDLIHYGFVKGRVRMGFSGYEVTSEDQYYYGLPAGVVVAEIAEDGALAGTDIQEGDIIYAVDGIEISSFQDIYDILSDHKAGDTVTLSVYRVEYSE